MADLSTTPPLVPASVEAAYEKIKDHVHRTPVLTSKTIDRIASENGPALNLFFKCENQQRIGAFKARGAFHAVLRLIDVLGLDEVKKRGVVTHSSGNHAQALALAGHTFDIPAYIVMPRISTPSKVSGTKDYTPHVFFSGSTSQEREAKVAEVIANTGAILVPPYDHPDILLGQGTTGLEFHRQVPSLQAVLTPCGGGGLLSGNCVYFSDKPVFVFGAEPSFQGGDDAKRGLAQGKRIDTVKTLTIADGLRTPIGEIPWDVFHRENHLEGIYSVREDQIKAAMKLVLERLKIVIEPSSAVPVAVVLYDEGWRKWVKERQENDGGGAWDVGIVLSGGNTTVGAIAKLFGQNE